MKEWFMEVRCLIFDEFLVLWAPRDDIVRVIDTFIFEFEAEDLLIFCIIAGKVFLGLNVSVNVLISNRLDIGHK